MSDGRRADEGDPLGLHLGQAPVQHGLLHLELGNAVTQQSPRLLGPLEHGDGVAGAGQLLRRGQAGGARADHGHGLAGGSLGHHRGHPTFGKGPLDDLVLDALDGHGVFVDPEDARRLTGGRAEPPGELREIVGGVQALHGLRPVIAVHQVVPLGDEVPQGAAVVAEGDTAVHAARALLLGRFGAEGLVDLAPVAQAHLDRPPTGQVTVELHEAGGLTHVPPP